MSGYAIAVIIVLLLIVLWVCLFGFDASLFQDHLEYSVLGYFVDGAGSLVYTVSVREFKTKNEVFFGNIHAEDYVIHPYVDKKWHIVPEHDRHLYLKKD